MQGDQANQLPIINDWHALYFPVWRLHSLHMLELQAVPGLQWDWSTDNQEGVSHECWCIELPTKAQGPLAEAGPWLNPDGSSIRTCDTC